MSESEVLVCVGGEADGRRVTVDPSSKWMRVPHIKSQWAQAWGGVGAPPLATVEVEYTLYERMTWRSGDLFRDVLKPQGQSPEQTLALLLDSYGK